MPDHDRDVSRFATILLWLFVVNLGLALGAGLYEARIVIPDWVNASGWHPEAVQHDDTGRRFWVAVTTIPLTLLTLANLVAGWRAPAGLRRWWLGAATVALVERVATLGYFIPTMVRLSGDGSSDALSTAVRWTQVNHVRHLLSLAALLLALRTFAFLYERRGALRSRS